MQRSLIERAKDRCRGEGWTVTGSMETVYRVGQLGDRRVMTRNELLDFAGVLPVALDCHFCVGQPELRAITVAYNTERKTGLHTMYRAECQCGTIGKCRPTRSAAIETWNEPWQARVGREFLTQEPQA